MPFIKINKANLYYELAGEGEPLVLISGLKADHTSWATMVPELSKRYTVLTIDNRGIGQTKDDGTEFSLEDIASDVITLARVLKLNKPHIIGHSMGGAVAQIIAHKYGDEISSVMLCNTFIKFNTDAARFFSDTVLKLHQAKKTQGEIMETIIPWVFDPTFVTKELIELIKKMSNEDPRPQSAADYQRQCLALCQFDSSHWITKIKVPALIVGSRADKTATLQESEALHKAITDSHWIELAGGHASAVEQTEPFVKAMFKFYQTLAVKTKQSSELESKQTATLGAS